MTGIIGNAKIITFRTTRDDSVYGTPLSAIASGISTGHVALLLTFNDRELFERYIARNDKIPHAVKIDPLTQEEYFEVYVSFWPQNQAGLYSDHSTLKTYEHDAESSAMNSPFVYSEEWLSFEDPQPVAAPELTDAQLAELIAPLTLEAQELRRVRELIQKSQMKAPLSLNPLQKIVAPKIPLLRQCRKSVITLGPMMIVHTSRLTNAYTAEIAAVVAAYAKFYNEWCEAEVEVQNQAIELGAEHIMVKRYRQMVHALRTRMRMAEFNLMHIIFPDEALTHDQFMQRMEPFITVGAPERDAIAFPIVRDFDDATTRGLKLEPMLQYICEVADNPHVHQYHVLKLNCAAVTYNTLWAGAKHSPDTELRKYLSLAWYVNMLNLTLTPTMIIQNAAKAERALVKGLQAVEREILQFSTPRTDDPQRSGCGKFFADLYHSAERFMRG